MSTPKFNCNSHLTKLHASVIDFGTRLMHSREPFQSNYKQSGRTSYSHLGCDELEINGGKKDSRVPSIHSNRD